MNDGVSERRREEGREGLQLLVPFPCWLCQAPELGVGADGPWPQTAAHVLPVPAMWWCCSSSYLGRASPIFIFGVYQEVILI